MVDRSFVDDLVNMRTPFLIPLLVLVSATLSLAGPKHKFNDISAALEKAKTENKILFLQFGREACGNCQELRKMISKNEIELPSSKFVYADVDCDDKAATKIFRQKFHVIGTTLPFVIVASPDGTQLAARTGYGSASEFQKLIKEAAARK